MLDKDAKHVYKIRKEQAVWLALSVLLVLIKLDVENNGSEDKHHDIINSSRLHAAFKINFKLLPNESENQHDEDRINQSF